MYLRIENFWLFKDLELDFFPKVNRIRWGCYCVLRQEIEKRREILTNFWEVSRPRLEFRPTLLCAPFSMNVDNCHDPCCRIQEKQTYKFTFLFHAKQSSLQPVLEKVIAMSNFKATFAKHRKAPKKFSGSAWIILLQNCHPITVHTVVPLAKIFWSLKEFIKGFRIFNFKIKLIWHPTIDSLKWLLA